MRPNVTINKRNGALGRRNPSTDGVCALVTTGVAVSGKLVLGTIYPLKSKRDALAIGLAEAYDTTNVVLVYHHIDRFFTRNPNGTLYIQVNAQTNGLADLCNLSNEFAKKVLRELKGAVKFIGVTVNHSTGYTPTLVTGLDEDVIDAIPNAQAIYADEFTKFRYASFLIEGKQFNGTAAAALDLRSLAAPNVSVTIAQDPAIAALDARFSKYAAVGDVLGLISKAAVSQNIGELTADFNLNDAGRGLFATAGLSSGLDVNSYGDEDLDTLDEKGYIFPTSVSGIDGFYLNDSHTCSPIGDNDFAYIENNRTIEKAIFLARTAILPFVKSRIRLDSDAGTLAPEDVKTLETKGKGSIAGMLKDGDISGGIDFYVDPEQNVLADGIINTELGFTPVSIGRQFVIGIGFVNPFKS